MLKRWLEEGAPESVRALLLSGLAIQPPEGAAEALLARLERPRDADPGERAPVRRPAPPRQGQPRRA